LLLALLLALPALPAWAGGFTINQMAARLDGERILVDGDVTIALTDDVREALTKSISLQVVMEIILHRERRWMWDKEITRWTIPAVIDYKPVSDQYIVTRPDLMHQQESFDNQADALKHAGLFKGLSLPLGEPLVDDRDYWLEAQIRLDLSALPTPMRPLVFFSSSWRLNSKWSEWPLQR